MSLLTPTAAKDYLNMASSTNDGEVQTFIDAVEAGLSRRLGPLTQTTCTDRLRGCRKVLQVQTTPLISLTSLTPWPFGSTLPSTYITTLETGQIEWYSMCFELPYYDAVYEAGHVADGADAPEDLLHAIRETLRHLWVPKRGSGTSRPGSADVQAVAGAAYAYTYRARELFDPFLQIPVGGA